MSSLSNITSPAFINRVGLRKKQLIHRMVFVRHGETLSNIAIMNNNLESLHKQSLDTPLSVIGVNQGQNVSDYLTQIGFIPDRIICSKLQRAKNTGKPFIESHMNISVEYDESIVEYNYKSDTIINPDTIDEWFYKKETNEEFIERVNNAFTKLSKYGSKEEPKQSLIYTHSQVISMILTNSLTGKLTETNIMFHISNGSITCIDLDEDGKYHIQCVNYTRHLDEPTGHHSDFI
jgi:broad specificity phosphatase PhoE